VFTNLTQDHLDFHGDMSRYGAAKAMLFSMPGLRWAVVNAADPAMAQMLAQCQAEVLSYGTADSRLSMHDLAVTAQGIAVNVCFEQHKANLRAALLGEFNASNLQAVVGVCLTLGHDLTAICAQCFYLQGVPGRMQKVSNDEQPLVLVDYAHTPDGLEKALQTSQAVAPAQALTVVFGCGGDRDRGKRPLMAAIAESYADQVVLTNDNPRNEEPEQIVRDMVAGLRHKEAEIILDRGEAIAQTIVRAQRRHTILIAGKGHEKTQEIKGEKMAFDDVQVARQALNQWAQRAHEHERSVR
jgi:UDP-N-acetylmuramoyl-L-alanyl-D-glutamate--2,6-diaminopimelate ligase